MIFILFIFYVSIQQVNPDHHTVQVLNFTEPSMEDYAYLSDSEQTSVGENRTLKPPDMTTTLSFNNFTSISVISSSRSILLPVKQGLVTNNASIPSRFYTSLSSTKPNPVGRPDTCTSSSSCQVNCHLFYCLYRIVLTYIITNLRFT